jgi:very-short-patch-repair endonuclease
MDTDMHVECRECGAKLPRLQWTHFVHKCSGEIKSLQEYRQKYPDAPTVSPIVAKKATPTKQRMLEKYGEEEGKKRWDDYRRKQAESNSLEYKAKKYGWTKEEFDEFNASRACSLKNMIARHGLEKGHQKWDEYCERQRYTTSVEYFIEREGSIEKGIEVWEKFCNDRGNGSNIYCVMDKYGLTFEEAQAKISEKNKGFASNLERKFVERVEEKVGKIHFTCLTSQMCLWNHSDGRANFYDLACAKKKKIIEFNGDYWHANPLLYEATDMVGIGVLTSASDVWERDKSKIENAMSRGYNVMIVWEKDWKDHPEEVLNNVKEFWNADIG